jgi:hypothetical protein
VARLKLPALVEMRGCAVVLTPIGVRRVANLPDHWEAGEYEWPRLRLAGGSGEQGEIDALERPRREAFAPGSERLKHTLAYFRDFPKEKRMRFSAKQAFCKGRDADGTGK